MGKPIKIALILDSMKARRDLGLTEKSMGSLERRSSKLGAALKLGAAGAAAGAIVALGAATKNAVGSALSYEAAQRKAAAALKVNNGAAGQTLDSLKKRAAEIETLSGATQDENEVIGAQSRLLRAGITDRAAFDKAVLASSNLAAANGQSIEGASKAIAKALQDPTKAAGALRKANVLLSSSQQDQIKKLVKGGDAAKAQAIVLDAINKQLAGQAAAKGAGGAASFAKLRDTLEDTGRDIAVKLLPSLSKLAKFLSDNLPGALVKLNRGFDFIGKVLPSAESLGKAFAVLGATLKNPIFQGFAAFLGGIGAALLIYNGYVAVTTGLTAGYAAVQAALNLVLTANPIGLLVLGIAGLVAVLVLAYNKSSAFRNIINGTFSVLKSGVSGVINFVTKNWPLILTLLTGPVGLAVLAFTRYRDKIIGIFQKIKDVVSGMFSGLGDLILTALKFAVNSAIELVNQPIRGINKIAGKVPGVPEIPEIPALARGGIVNSPTLALIGEAGPEAVVPLGNGFGTTEVTINVEAGVGDPAAIGRQVWQTLVAFERSMGRRVVTNET